MSEFDQQTMSLALSARYGRVASEGLVVRAALLAAHGAAGRPGGFRPSDVRFFFLLFANWLEYDLSRPGQDIDLTQVRRALERLVREGRADLLGAPRGRRPAPRTRRYALTPSGLVALAESLSAAPLSGGRFEETLFLICFCACYRGPIAARVRGETRPLNPAARRRVEEALDPRRVLASARRSLAALSADLERRLRGQRELEGVVAAARSSGLDDVEVARRLERSGSYRLHHVRPLGELVASLPEELRGFELGEAMALRRTLLFEPMAEQAAAQCAALDRLACGLGLAP